MVARKDDDQFDRTIEIAGSYSVLFETKYVHLTGLGATGEIDDLAWPNVHSCGPSLFLEPKRDSNNADVRKLRRLELLPRDGMPPDLASCVIFSPVEGASATHNGKFVMHSNPAHSDNASAPIISFMDINDSACSFQCNIRILPFDDLEKRTVLSPLNDFRLVLVDSSGAETTSSTHRGSFMRESGFDVVSASPTLESVMKMEIRAAFSAAVAAPALISLKMTKGSAIHMSAFSGGYRFGEKQNQTLQGECIDLHDIDKAAIKLRIEKASNQDIAVHATIDAQIGGMDIGGVRIRSFWPRFVETFISVLSTPWLETVLGGLYAGVLLLWFQKKAA
jgi:hypothetical protein